MSHRVDRLPRDQHRDHCRLAGAIGGVPAINADRNRGRPQNLSAGGELFAASQGFQYLGVTHLPHLVKSG
jgi:hypothetical protein